MKLTSIKYTGSNLKLIKTMINKPIKLVGFEDDPRGHTLEFVCLDGIKHIIEPGNVLHFKGCKFQTITKG